MAERGKNKHLIDIYAIIIGKEELDLDYLLGEVIPYVSKITDLSETEIVGRMCSGNENALPQFIPKERRFISQECKRILEHFKYMKGVVALTKQYSI